MRVIAKLQGIEGNIVDMPYANDATAIEVIGAVADLLNDKDKSPFAPKTLSITIEL